MLPRALQKQYKRKQPEAGFAARSEKRPRKRPFFVDLYALRWAAAQAFERTAVSFGRAGIRRSGQQRTSLGVPLASHNALRCFLVECSCDGGGTAQGSERTHDDLQFQWTTRDGDDVAAAKVSRRLCFLTVYPNVSCIDRIGCDAAGLVESGSPEPFVEAYG